jgi:CheY-like chemotaxis protein
MSRVLVVDDEPDVRLVARMVLSVGGHDVVEASTGEEALDALEIGPRPDAVLLDIRMPGIDGWEVLRRVRAHPTLSSLPVVVFTAHLSAREDPMGDLPAYDRFLTKPFEPDDLLGAVEEAMAVT